MYRRICSDLCLLLLASVFLSGSGCVPRFDAKDPSPSASSFGEKFFTIACQRVAYTASLNAAKGGPDIPVDVAGQRYGRACRHGAQFLPEDTRVHAPKVATLFQFREPLIEAVNMIPTIPKKRIVTHL